MKKIFVLATIMLLSTKIMAQTLERMQWFNEPWDDTWNKIQFRTFSKKDEVLSVHHDCYPL